MPTGDAGVGELGDLLRQQDAFEVRLAVVPTVAGEVAVALREAGDVGRVGQVGRHGQEERPAVVARATEGVDPRAPLGERGAVGDPWRPARRTARPDSSRSRRGAVVERIAAGVQPEAGNVARHGLAESRPGDRPGSRPAPSSACSTSAMTRQVGLDLRRQLGRFFGRRLSMPTKLDAVLRRRTRAASASRAR